MRDGLAGKVKSGEMDAIAQIIGIMFMSRTYSHMSHLKTSSYSQHKALNKFYDSIVDLADDLAEAAQGKYGKLDIPFINMSGSVKDPISGLKMQWDMISEECEYCTTPFIDNIVQEIEALYSKTLYLLTELN